MSRQHEAEGWAVELNSLLSDMEREGFKLNFCCSDHIVIEDENDDNIYAHVELR